MDKNTDRVNRRRISAAAAIIAATVIVIALLAAAGTMNAEEKGSPILAEKVSSAEIAEGDSILIVSTACQRTVTETTDYSKLGSVDIKESVSAAGRDVLGEIPEETAGSRLTKITERSQ